MAEITFPPGHGIPLVRLSDYLFVSAVQDAQDEHLAAKLKPDIDAAKKAASDARKAKQGLEEAEANAKDYASHAEQAKKDAEEARDDITALVGGVDPEAIATAVADYLAANPAAAGLAALLDNGDGTLTLSGSLVADNLDGTLTIGA